MAKTKLWALFIALAILVATGAGYFLVLSPQKAEAAKADKTAAGIQSTNDGLRLQITRLKKAEALLPAAQARIAAIDARIPATPSLPSYVRWLVKAAANAHVELVSISPTVPQVVTAAPAAVAPVAVAPAAGKSSAAAAPAAPPAAQTSGLSAITVSYNIVGNYFQVQSFLRQLEGSPRATVVSTITMAPGSLPRGSGDTRPVPPPWQTLQTQITATIFMSGVPTVGAGVAAPAAPAAGSTAAPAVPAAPSTASTASPNS